MKETLDFITDKDIRITGIVLAGDFLKRLKGYMFQNDPGHGGILFMHCNSIHSFFMRFSIDLIFLDKNMRVVHTVYGFQKNKTITVKEARHVLELPTGILEASSISVGDELMGIDQI